MRNRSNLLVLLGIAFFVVGGIIVYVLTDDEDGGGSADSEVTVLVADADIAAGTLADDVIEGGGFREENVASNQVEAGAIRSTSQLQGATFVQSFAEGQQITAGGLTALDRRFEVPAGFEAIAVQVDFVAGVAGYVSPGDRINVYGAYDTQTALGDRQTPRAELLLTNVEVLDVDLSIPSRRGTSDDPSVQRQSGDNITYLLAVRTADAEKLVYQTQFQSMYATLTADDAPPAGPTPGRDGENILEVEPNVAAA